METIDKDVNLIKVSMGKIEEKIDNIDEKIDHLKICHDAAQTCVNTIQVELASRPTTQELRNVITMVSIHSTYFKIISGAILLILGFLSALALKII